MRFAIFAFSISWMIGRQHKAHGYTHVQKQTGQDVKLKLLLGQISFPESDKAMGAQQWLKHHCYVSRAGLAVQYDLWFSMPVSTEAVDRTLFYAYLPRQYTKHLLKALAQLLRRGRVTFGLSPFDFLMKRREVAYGDMPLSHLRNYTHSDSIVSRR